MTSQPSAVELKELAEKATSGPWERVEYHVIARAELTDIATMAGPPRMDVTNADYISAANPQMLLALLEDWRKMKEALGQVLECDDAAHIIAYNALEVLHVRD